jgi:probable rRNA maturation factor
MERGITVSVHVEEGLAPPLGAERIEAAVQHVLAAEGVAAAEISVALVGDDSIAALNHEYLLHEGPTDVISFPLHRPGQDILGDIYIGVDEAGRHAADYGIPLDVELLRLAVHGTLHVLGYDHPHGEARESSPMYRRQEELLAGLLKG